MKKCTVCGFENQDSLKFCGECGNRLDIDTPLNESTANIDNSLQAVFESSEMSDVPIDSGKNKRNKKKIIKDYHYNKFFYNNCISYIL